MEPFMEQWKEYRLGEIGKVVGGATPSTKDASNYDGDISWITPKDLSVLTQRYIYRGERMITLKGYNSCSCKLLPKGSVLFSSRAPIGYVAIASKELCTNQGFKSILPFPNIVDSMFLYYLLVNNRKRIEGLGSGTTFKEVSLKVMQNVKVKIPSMNTQHKIASVLSSIDDKIELNRKINSNLEEQAKALFKSWFIDFEPFKDGKFVDSELGKIPEGWKVGRYDDIVSATVVGDWGKDKPIGNYVHEVTCIRGCDFQDIKNGLTGNAPSRFILEKNFKNKCFANNDILVEISGGTQTVSTGRVCPISQELISRYNGNVVCTNFCRVLRPIEEYSAFIYYSWLYKYNHKVMFGYENGTSGIKNFRLNDFLSMEPLIIPPKDKVAEFQKVIDTINAQMQTTGLESSKLVETRDSLLPRLMSGEIDVRL